MAREAQTLPSSSKHRRKTRVTYATRLTATFASVAAVTVVISLALLALAWGQRFETYSNERLQRFSSVAAETLEQRYRIMGGWEATTVEALPAMMKLSGGMDIRVLNSEGTIVFDSLAPGADGQPQAIDFTKAGSSTAVVVDGERVGMVYVVPSSAMSLSESEASLLADSYDAIAIAGAIAIVLALFFGMFFSRSLVSPLRYIGVVAKQVQRGNIAIRTGMSGRSEFSQLGHAIDEMIESIERNAVMERQLTTDLAHELRTPLMAMQATIEAMIDGALSIDSARLATLDSEVMRLGRLVEAQLKLSRLERGTVIVDFAQLNLSELVTELVSMHEMLMEDAQLSVLFEAEPEVEVSGDSDLLRQAITNLISNAVRYTPAGGSVSLTVRKKGNLAQVIVSDTGIGISVDHITHIFTRFWRADTGRSSESGALGIGLAMVKGIADRHGGWVDVKSVLGQGSTFILNLPLYRKPRNKKRKR